MIENPEHTFRYLRLEAAVRQHPMDAELVSALANRYRAVGRERDAEALANRAARLKRSPLP